MPSQPQHPAGLLLGSLEASGSKTALVDRCAREGSAFQERQRSYCIEKMKTITKLFTVLHCRFRSTETRCRIRPRWQNGLARDFFLKSAVLQS